MIRNLIKSNGSMSNFSFISKRFKSLQISNVCVIGCGIMGSGIAQVTAQSSYNVNLVGIDEKLLNKSKSGIEKSLIRVAKKTLISKSKLEQDEFVKNTLDKINFSTDIIESSKNADLIIEAVTENIELKQTIFSNLLSKLSDDTDRDTIFTSNTSSLSIEEIFKPIVDLPHFKSNLTAGLHFFNPVPMMSLVEIVKLHSTSPDVVKALTTFIKSLNKVPIHCYDTPGFIVNRLLVPFLSSAIKLLERGDATAEDIDQAMKLGSGHPMGPLQLADYVGLDTMKFILDGWSERFPNQEEFKCPDLLKKLVEQGKLGKKSGEGFYKY